MSMVLGRRAVVACLASTLAVLAGGCATSPAPDSARAGRSVGMDVRTALSAPAAPIPASMPMSARATAPGSDYRVGPGDVLEISVFQAEELDRTVRVRPDGTISLPLLGVLAVENQSTSDLEDLLRRRYEADYVRNPQISVFVREYRSHPISILGEVRQPGLYYLQEPRSLLEMLSMAGGLNEDAGTTVFLRRPDPAHPGVNDLISVELASLLHDERRALAVMVQDDDTLYVPKAGVVFVEGAVKKPGAYPLQGAPTILKAITMAGGLAFEAKRSGVRLVRDSGGEPEVTRVDVVRIREDPSLDLVIQDGDVVVVGTHAVKMGLVGFWRGLQSLVNVGMKF